MLESEYRTNGRRRVFEDRDLNANVQVARLEYMKGGTSSKIETLGYVLKGER
jgi:hypothetical protein